MKYKVTIEEKLVREVEVEANDFDEALENVKDMYNNSEIILSADDFTNVDFYSTTNL